MSIGEVKYTILKCKGIITAESEINKNKINLISGTVTHQLAETILAFTNKDNDTIKLLANMLNQLYDGCEGKYSWDFLRLLYGIIGLKIPEDVELLAKHPQARQYFIFSFLLDFNDTIQDYIAENED